MDYKKSRTLLSICLWTALILCLFSLVTNIDWIGVLGVVTMVLGIVQTAVFYRCPYCRKTLNFRGRPPRFCPECGHELER